MQYCVPHGSFRTIQQMDVNRNLRLDVCLFWMMYLWNAKPHCICDCTYMYINVYN